MLYAGGLLAFTIIHFLLFAFYPTEKRNLYFALFTGFLAILTFALIETGYSDSPLMAIRYYRISLITWILTVLYALRFSYSLFYSKPPVQFWIFLVVGLFLATATWFNAAGLDLYRELYVVLTLLEIVRVILISFFRQREGVWIIGTGLICFVSGIMYTVLANVNIISADPVYGNLYGSVLLVLAMSVYLSREFARTQKRLEYKLIEVKHLSERSLEQERINKKKEIERKLLEAENKRKSNELEEARALQLSMLPKQIPQTPFWDIAVFMETAQEVGGDYYDFSVSNNGTMSIVVGDATGHGMKAGIMVATAKSYFHTLVNEHNNIEMLRRISSGIRNMDLKLMFMGMMVFKCNGHNINYTSAGMPPVLYYDSDAGEVEKLILKGMPLGSKIDYPYKEKNLELKPGDSLLLMSDGLMELFNEERELLGLNRIERAFKEAAAGTSASSILSQITKLINSWAGRKVHEDDITVVVLKAKPVDRET
jgi:serine phosphatase RsbU (regulator of sigma subunit)